MDTEVEFEAYSNLTNIQQFYYGQSVFLTGVTGLVGKVVLEKLLRSCPGIGMVYILMRPKRGLSTQQRVEKIFNLELFREVKKVFPLFRKRVYVIEGDISKYRLGMTFEDYEKLCQNVSIVIHSAASVNFNDPLKLAVEHNLTATNTILDMCHDMPHIKAFVHVSTAFVKREPDNFILEEIPKAKVAPEQLMDALTWMDEKSQTAVMEYMTQNKLLTTYLVTKALAETLIDQKRKDLPVSIVRPSFIGPTCKEPFPGWIDSLQGIGGLIYAGAKGVLRTLLSVENLRTNAIPVDMVSNTIIASAWHVGTTKPPPLFIVNTVFDFDKLPIADNFLPFALSKRDIYPLASFFRYPDFTIYYNKYAHAVHAFFDHWIPAIFIDLILFIFTGKTILVKVHRKINFLYDIFYRLGREPWICKLDNINFLKTRLSEEDSEVFNFETDNFNWEVYIEDCFLGGRKFIAKEDISNLPYARRKAKIWWAVTTTLKWILILFFLYYVFTRSFFLSIYENIEEKFFNVHPVK